MTREPEPIGIRLRRLRTERRLSQRELAGPGVSYAYISRIEAGTRRPSVKALRQLARKLGVSPEYLETGSELRDVDERELRLADAELAHRIGGEPEQAQASFENLLREAREAGDGTSAARAEIGMGLVAMQLSDPHSAVQHLERAIDANAVSPLDRPEAFTSLARALTLTGRADDAVELLERCRSEIGEKDPDNVAAYVRYAGYLSAVLTDAGDLSRAEDVLTDALQRAEDVGDSYTRVRLYWSIARLSEREGQSARALDYARRAVALLEATEDTHQLARAHLLCAWIMGMTEKGVEAKPHLDRAESLLQSGADSADIAILRVEQSKIAAQLGDSDEAVLRARQAIEALPEEYEVQHGSAWWALAEGLALQGNVDEAVDAFSRSVDALDRTGQFREAAQACRRWAKVLRDAGRDVEALDALERATDYAVRTQPTVQAPRDR